MGDFRRVGGDLALYLGGADVAVVQCGIIGSVACALFLGIVAGGLVRTDGQGADGRVGLLEVLAADLGDQGDGWAEHDGQFACRREFLGDAQGDAGLAGAAGQDDLAAGLAHWKAAAFGLFMFLENPHAFGDGLVLHAGLGLPAFLAVEAGIAVGAFFMG